ncbi:hypothetical protein KPL76_00065 [Subtercola sp. PAMC28395]|uniref:hypothetical protein n=1 Tax=Subtercola sp. PAMC28395 TaxID=2846775 RepID=UPI001C0C7382|nr:hypothetical protein [Subtercola sp. PAMC28395]QWT23892.1 hypothetical protein KPL76_00065 [Subtercola sp. PAMC28395]
MTSSRGVSVRILGGGRAKQSRAQAELFKFGDPIFDFTDQPRLLNAGWTTYNNEAATTIVGSSYWIADERGDFRFTDDVGHLLRGEVHTEVPGSSSGWGASDEHSALVRHLASLLINVRMREPGFVMGSAEEWYQTTESWTREVQAQSLSRLELSIDGRVIPVDGIRYDGYTASSTRIAGRIVTVALHDDDAQQIDDRLVSRAIEC